jgi:molybdopterin/thiamine biosynthesis adenylyltransferase
MPDNSAESFDHKLAFSRTIGLVTHEEQEILKNKTVAIAGLGGVGGSHVLTLVRLGIGGLHISDMDTFGVENFNRQAGANMNTVGRKKIEVLKEMALAINPNLRIKTFPEGISQENIVEFFKGVDTYVDGLDFFVFRVREKVFKYCYSNNIPVTTVGPIGMGAALVNFLPGKMTFDQYFNWKDTDSELQLGIKFLLGLSPKAPHRAYIVDQSAIRIKEKKGPSTPMGCELSAGVAGAEVLKILLGRGNVSAAPHSFLFDAYNNKYYHHHLIWGNRGPLQRLKIMIATKMMSKVK